MKRIFMTRAKYLGMLVIVFMTALCVSSCGGDDDDDSSSSVPSSLIGTWHKSSGASGYSMRFSFNQDGTGSGYISSDRIIMVRSYSYTYSYKSNGNVVCKGTYVLADESGESTSSTTLTFHFDGSTLTGIEGGGNSRWTGCTFSK